MKILTSILNILAVLFIIIGIGSSIYWGNEWVHRNDIDPMDEQIDSLQDKIDRKDVLLQSITDELNNERIKTTKFKELWSTERSKLRDLLAERKRNQNKVKNLPIDEMLDYILDYFNSDTTNAQLLSKGDSVYIIMTPKLVDTIGQTIAQHQDNLELIDAYEIQVSLSDSLIHQLEAENVLLELRNSTLDDINNDLTEQNEMYKTSRAEKDKQIKRLKFQRTIIGIGGVVLIILVAL